MDKILEGIHTNLVALLVAIYLVIVVFVVWLFRNVDPFGEDE